MKKKLVFTIKKTGKTRQEWELENGGSFTDKQWSTIKASFNYRCVECGRKEGVDYGFPLGKIRLTADHVKPVTWGGSGNIENIQPLCRPCNSSKGARTDTDYRNTFFKRLWNKFPQDQLERIVRTRVRLMLSIMFEADLMDGGKILSDILSWELPEDYLQVALREYNEWFRQQEVE